MQTPSVKLGGRSGTANFLYFGEEHYKELN